MSERARVLLVGLGPTTSSALEALDAHFDVCALARPGFDAVVSRALETGIPVQGDVRLSAVVDQLPRVHLAHETVVTPWDQKGAVMRSLVEHVQRETVLVDGVKVIHDGGWALALPDPEEAVTHVWAEADSDADARRLAQEYARRIRQMLR
jgi:mannose-1-phosphate guanylyltransferase/phosphomannomutase